MLDYDSFIHNIRAETVKAYAEVFSTGTTDVIRCQFDAAQRTTEVDT